VLLQNLYQFDNPYVAMTNAANLGLADVTVIRPVRQLKLGEGVAHIREFDAITIRDFPARVMVAVIQGAVGAVERRGVIHPMPQPIGGSKEPIQCHTRA
jgi:hypothetical protein